ncbi:MAG TPA: hypothetical protein VJS69_11435 [Candidatus Krumholzibacteria bacterium]|nr:hypothetical protein [Candidatus Krumholzibacteria bacterium]
MTRFLIMAACLVLPVVVSAAEPHASGDLSAALQKAKVGATLRVETSGTPVIGRFAGLSRGAMVLNGKTRAEVPLETVRSMSELKSARSTGIKWGALIGLGAGLVVAKVTDKSNDATVSDNHFDLARYGYYAVAGILVGGSVGGIVGSAKGHWEPIYP